MNWAQELLFDNLWFLNLILKARQLGISTFFGIYNLDSTLFEGKDSGLIAHTREDAQRIFDTKIKYPWDNLPEAIKEKYELNTDSVRELKFRRGKIQSSIYTGTSLRSGTVQNLHISELGTIDQKYPRKAEEIRSGALNTVHAGQLVTIESTAKGQAGLFYEFCKEALRLQRMGKKLSTMDYKLFFFPWWKHPEYRMEGDVILSPEIKEYFEKIQAQEGIELTADQKNWYAKKKQTQGEAMKSEFPSTPEEAFFVSIEGAYFGKKMNRVMEDGRITKVPWIDGIPVDTWWDLGTNKKKTDAMSIVFTQDIGVEVHVIDYYGNSGEGLSHYKKVLDNKPYSYGKHWAPHDIEVKEIGTGKTRLEIAREMGISFDVVENIPFSDGIEAVRAILSRCWFDEKKTQKLVQALISFRKEWDDNLGKFKDQPLRDWSKDPADAFRMMAVGHPDQRKLGEYDQEEEQLSRIYQERQNKEEGGYDPLNPFGL